MDTCIVKFYNHITHQFDVWSTASVHIGVVYYVLLGSSFIAMDINFICQPSDASTAAKAKQAYQCL